jgi:type I restriction enzyme S subunit
VSSGVSVNASNVPAEEHQCGVLKTSAVSAGKFFPEENKAVWDSELDRLGCPVTSDSLIISRMNTPSLVGESGYVAVDHPNLFLPDRLWKLTFNTERVFTPYISHVLSSPGAREALSSMATGTSPSMKNLSIEEMGGLPIPLPSIGEQRIISDFLQSETSRIDGLIAEKERMLALLEEKRSALISRVVTQGLDPDALVKASGHAWLGEIPTHWEAIRIKLITASLDQGSSPIAANTPAATDELGVLKLSAVTKGRFKREENKALRGTDHEEHLLALRKGDVLITRGNTPDLVADVACVPEDEPNLLLPDLIYRLRVKEEKILAEYLTAFLTTAEARFQIRRDARGSSGSMVKVSQGHVLDWLTPLPPLFEQVEIMNYLRRTEERFQSIAREVSSSLSLLSDRRAALISAAVTGQIPLEEMT